MLNEETKRGQRVVNALSRPERQDLSCPSLINSAPPHIVAEMQMIKEQMDFMMNALRGRVSSDLDDLVHQTDSPFITSINSFLLPPKFRIPQIESYNRTKDPLDHLESFKTLMHLQGMADEIMCKVFPTTQRGLERIWFSKLTPNSISTFKDLSASSLHTLSGDIDIRS